MAESFAPLRATTGICAHITVIDGQLTTTTQDIATVYGKDHDKVVRIVRQRMAEAGEWGIANFGDTPYTNPQNGQTYTVIRMTKKGFHFVVGKFTGAKAVAHQIAFADGFERMEAQLSGNSGELPAPPKAIPAQAIKTHSAQQCEAALQAGGVASLQVQMALARAVLDGGDDWQNLRWLISFVPNSQRGAPPLVQCLAADTMVLEKPDVINLMANITADVWTEMKQKMDKRQGVAA